MNGRVERFFSTLKLSLDQLAVDGRDALNSALVDFRFFDNNVRGPLLKESPRNRGN